MIRVFYSETPFSLEVKGHAAYDAHGKDIVCAAVSSSVAGGLLAFEDLAAMQTEQKDGYIYVRSNTELSQHDKIVFQTILTQLREIEKEYPKYLKIGD